MKKTFLLFLFLWVANLFAQQNTLIIIADDLGYDYLGFYENAGDTANVPNIRSLLSSGVRFTNAWASPLCSPTRAGIFTGRYPFRTGVGSVIAGTTSPELDTAEIGIPELLRYHAPQKYHTANVGKWHLHNPMPQKRTYPNRMGYELYAGNFSGELPNYYSWTKVTNGVLDTIANYATTETVNDAIAWLDSVPNDRPFFLWLAFNAPHTPFHNPPANLHTVQGLIGTPAHIQNNPQLYFKAATEAMDTEIGRLFQWLRANNQMDSTNIIFIGDNGSDKRVRQISDSTHCKGTIYEYGIHVPFLISGPQVLSPNRVCTGLINTPDIFATVLEWSNFDQWQTYIPANKLPIDSKSLLPILKNQTNSVRDWIFSEVFTTPATTNDGKAIRDTTYKLMVFDDGHKEFYNLKNDETEQQNLLNGTLNMVELTHYNYLCNELNALLGINTCTTVENTLPFSETFLLYPNPTKEKVTIKTTAPISVEVYDIVGQRILQTQAKEITVSSWAKGMYFFYLYEKSKPSPTILKFWKE